MFFLDAPATYSRYYGQDVTYPEPLMLHGRCVPALSALTLLMTHGKDAVENHPGLQALER